MIAIYLNDSGYKGIDLSNPNKGNPGIGGTQYCFAMLLYNYQYFFPNEEIIFLHHNNNIYPKTKISVVVTSIIEAANIAKDYNSSLFLFFCDEITEKLASLFDNLKLKGVGWAHNFVDARKLKLLKKHKFFWHIVFVGREQYDKYVDDWAVYKCSTIENMYQVPSLETDYRRTHNVVYTGALRRSKGFHLLAKCWKNILEIVPDAQLYVAGSGQLYNRNTKLGKYGLAEESYENEFIKYIINEQGQIINSIHFLGIVSDKDTLYKNTRVGVVNPTCISECLPITALEMQSLGVPVVSGKKKGMVDAVKHNKTGLLAKNEKKFINNIVLILNNDTVYNRLHICGPQFVNERFSPKSKCKEWNRLFSEIANGKKIFKIKYNFHNLNNNLKFLRYINHLVKFIFFFLPSFAQISLFSSNVKKHLVK